MDTQFRKKIFVGLDESSTGFYYAPIITRNCYFWSAIATAPTSASAGAKKASNFTEFVEHQVVTNEATDRIPI